MAFVPLNPYYYLAFDPGEKTSGLATFNEEGKLTGVYSIGNGLRGVVDWWERNFSDIPKTPDYIVSTDKYLFPHVIICETYRVRDYQFKHFWSKVPTIRVIGVIEAYAYKCGAKWVEQESGRMYDGIKWSGNELPPKGSHIPDTLSALGHGVYYLYKVAKKWEIKL